jgi:hypothetical protein
VKSILLKVSALVMALLATEALGQTPWERFLAHPSGENAAAVSTVAYSTPPPSDDASASEQRESDLSVLLVQIAAHDPHAIDLGFRLIPELDGALAESMDIALGRLIRANPRLFLEHLKANRSLVNGLEGLVGNFGEEYVDRESAHVFETNKRINALRSVTDPGLREVRDECIQALRRHAA